MLSTAAFAALIAVVSCRTVGAAGISDRGTFATSGYGVQDSIPDTDDMKKIIGDGMTDVIGDLRDSATKKNNKPFVERAALWDVYVCTSSGLFSRNGGVVMAAATTTADGRMAKAAAVAAMRRVMTMAWRGVAWTTKHCVTATARTFIKRSARGTPCTQTVLQLQCGTM